MPEDVSCSLVESLYRVLRVRGSVAMLFTDWRKSAELQPVAIRDQPLKYADLSPTVKTEFCEFSCMRAFCL